MENYGFVYLWFDTKHKKFYIGSHWGTETDRYICSSKNMRQNYKNRPYDFKRRILKKIYTNRKALLDEEQRWLDMICPHEYIIKYYNISSKARRADRAGVVWNKNKSWSEEVKQKIKNSWYESRSEEVIHNRKGTRHTEQARQKIKIARAKQVITEDTKIKMKAAIKDRKSKGLLVGSPKGWKHTPEAIEKIRARSLKQDPTHFIKMRQARLAKLGY